ncbi:hypothetical protein [Gracilibacillus sp. D59]|uniref:hypothetical protein n=1 Tax=Gracilibacillus sp. D59 TaxID=3457434 RepID=UPI003FCE5A7B
MQKKYKNFKSPKLRIIMGSGDYYLFNEVLHGQQTPVNIGSPENAAFLEQMNQLVMYINTAIPYLLRNLEKER